MLLSNIQEDLDRGNLNSLFQYQFSFQVTETFFSCMFCIHQPVREDVYGNSHIIS
jgi:hypothetical protein